MPLYEYRCSECKRRFTLLVGVTAAKARRACPKCGSRKLTKLISRIAPVVRQEDLGGDFDEADLGPDDEFGDDYDGGDYDDFDD